ncbi:glycosyltransferase family 2 protein [Blastopirellula retiformator]|uniref:N-acetylglucosaminyl-diphospho-decaprenol L-rhamnosyltransferase n=1 Tax=Blastopirellula retiformator TaxID=2527970 RepID=A0A5C5V7S0_9BACT|nr:glycosyltransferase family 2 protein [Blastopirellula retiformator]TWT34566.1 N-acetylglucosaminyl-diphospho-decaprenol L-rhamnosyltransferase [Blastopirellula retiformator]
MLTLLCLARQLMRVPYLAVRNLATIWHLPRYSLSLLYHYLSFCLLPAAQKTRAKEEFDEAFYREAYFRSTDTALSPFEHYMIAGWRRGYSPFAGFDGPFYTESYVDCSRIRPPLLHYCEKGRRLGLAINQGQSKRMGRSRNINLMAQRRDEDIRKWTCRSASEFDPPAIDVSIVTYNSASWLDRFFASLLVQAYPLERMAIHVRDNGSSDATVEKLEAFRKSEGSAFADFVVSCGANVGFGRGHDAAIAGGRGEFVLVTNVDLEFERDSIVRAVETAVSDRGSNFACWELRQRPFEHPKYYDPVTLEANWCSHACILLQRNAYADVGGYDPDIFMYGEDVELSFRFRRSGYRLKYVPNATVVHHTRAKSASGKNREFMGILYANAWLRLKYGTLHDIGEIFLLYRKLLNSWSILAWRNKRRLIAQTEELAYRMPDVLKQRGELPQEEGDFAFESWDYDLRRNIDSDSLDDPNTGAPLVSIVVRTVDGRQLLLKQALTCLVNQTYLNIEVIVVEDGGEASRSLVDDFEPRLAKADKRICYLPLERVGRSVAGNRGLEAATGEYVMFYDDDDLLFADHVETLVARMVEEPRAAAVFADSFIVETRFHKDDQNVVRSYEELSHYPHENLVNRFNRGALLRTNLFPIQAVLFRRHCFEKLGGFDPTLDALEDWILWCRYSQLGGFIRVPKTTSLYRIPASVEEKHKRSKHFSAYQSLADELSAR